MNGREELPDDVLNGEQRQALLDACSMTVDVELDGLLRGDDPTATSDLFHFLPPIARGPDEFVNYRMLLVALITIGQKLAARDRPEPSCVAEEIALSYLIGEAEAQLKDRGIDHPGFETFIDTVFEDTDFELLWDPSVDGIEDSELGTSHRIVNLHPRDWGKPFRPDLPVHPFLGDVSTFGG